MPRLQHARTRSIADVDDVTAAGLGPEWKPLEAAKPAAAKRTAGRGRAKGSETGDDASGADNPG